ncbi:nucleoside hydrolase [Sneathiella chinensis]|uniref:Ribosylpyrimidine nucleosidase n=1 Tax=Sneathiella chinensis TaxID=349750 RepID=A0ABQ5U3I3_9PROT|nr:nucleoside hydrolase [Sneathiella chinensis]GLQ06283.1 ribosylpyrimidine nucleosidase [Sneathiella chinensis]
MEKRHVILDCDPGQDDAVAILLALASEEEINLLGITTVGGNVPLYWTESNARRICELANRPDMKVFAGASGPLMRKLVTAEWIHGKTGIDGANLPDPTMPLQEAHGVDFIVETCMAAGEGEITLCPIGPMTNIALAMMKEPQIIPKIREIVCMGGAVREMGNVTPAAEFNIYVDPHAAKVVLDAGVPFTMMPLDVTHKALVTPDRLQRFKDLNSPVGDVCGGMLDYFNRFDMTRYGFDGGPLHDPCVIAYLIDPDIFQGRRVFMDIETRSELTLGQTVADWWNIQEREPNAYVCDSLDAEAFFDLLTTRLARLK